MQLPTVRNFPRGLHHLTIWRKVEGSFRPEVPVLYVRNANTEPMEPMLRLLDYIKAHPGMSVTWLLYRCRAFGAFVDFVKQNGDRYTAMASHRSRRSLHRTVVREFITAMIKGTVQTGGDGIEDATGLYWLPAGLAEVKRRLEALRDVASWLDTEGHGDTLANAALPEIPSDPSGALDFLYTAQVTRRISLLDYLSPFKKTAPKRTRDAFGRKGSSNAPIFSFPKSYIVPLLERGFVSSHRRNREDPTTRLLSMFMFLGSIRGSEGLHVWLSDVQFVDGEAVLFLYHPADSMVTGSGGHSVTRRMYLMEHFGRRPRCDFLKGPEAAGWKGVKGDLNGATVHWLPIPGIGKAIGNAVRSYVHNVRAPAMRIRKSLGLPDHPYLLVSTGDVIGASVGAVGDPYSMSAFQAAWERAVERLRRETDDPTLEVAKRNGTTPHGSRHFYATTLRMAGLDRAYLQACLHHINPFSLLAYEHPTVAEISTQLQNAANQVSLPGWGTFEFLSTIDALRAERDRRYGVVR